MSDVLRKRLLIVGGASIVALVAFALFDLDAALRGYLVGWLLCLAAALGAMAWTMIHHLTGGRFGWLIRRPGEAAAATLPAIAVAFLPIALGARRLFPWADAHAIAASELLRHRNVAFATPLTLGRAGVFLALWCSLGWLLGRWSRGHDRDSDPRHLARLATLSAAGLIVYFVTMSLASVDWIASREVDWYSSTFGVLTVLGQATSGLCVLILAVWLSRDRAGLRELLDEKRATHDLGNLLLVSVVLWAYVSFMQFLVIWSGDSQEDNRWFVHRNRGAWQVVGIALIALHFAVPFLLLLQQDVKRNLNRLALVAAGVLVMRAVDVVWTIVPSEAGKFSIAEPLAIVGCFALWAWHFAGLLDRAPIVPRARELERGPLGAATREGADHVVA